MDYDFDFVERLIDLETHPKKVSLDKYGRLDRQEQKRSVSRSRSRSHNRRKRSRQGDRRSRSGSYERMSRGSRRQSPDSRERRADEERRRRQEEDRKKHHDRSRREDCSVMVMGLHPSCGDREVYEFFSKEAGKVRDLYVVRDQRTGKSRGVAYVEFYLQESIMKALACNGRMISGHGPIRVQASGAEKNRAAVAQREATSSLQEKPIVLYIMGLTGPLSAMTEAELKSIFSPFGEIEYATITRCPYTGRGRGHAKILFTKAADAREAMACLNGFELAGETLQVGYLSGSLGTVESGTTSRADSGEDGVEYIRSNEERAKLMDTLTNRRF
jgi:RNA-binding protein 39